MHKQDSTKMNVSEAFNTRSMKSMLGDHVLRNGLSRLSYDQNSNKNVKFLPAPFGHADNSLRLPQKKVKSAISMMNELGMLTRFNFSFSLFPSIPEFNSNSIFALPKHTKTNQIMYFIKTWKLNFWLNMFALLWQ
mgnify:CR=1 FL=1